jgi:hypothetical protein
MFFLKFNRVKPKRLLLWMKINSIEIDSSGCLNMTLSNACLSVFIPDTFENLDPFLFAEPISEYLIDPINHSLFDDGPGSDYGASVLSNNCLL